MEKQKKKKNMFSRSWCDCLFVCLFFFFFLIPNNQNDVVLGKQILLGMHLYIYSVQREGLARFFIYFLNEEQKSTE